MSTPETEKMREFLENLISTMQSTGEDRINKMMNYSLVDCCHDPLTLTIALPVTYWMMNPARIMHGGLVATALDIALGCMSLYVSEDHKAATAQLSVNFIRPVSEGDRLLLTSFCHKPGRTMAHITGHAVSENTGKTVATASGVFSTMVSFNYLKPQ